MCLGSGTHYQLVDHIPPSRVTSKLWHLVGMKVELINKNATTTGTFLGKLKRMVTLLESDHINNVQSRY